MSTKFSGLNPKGPYLSLEQEKEHFCVVFTYPIRRRRAREIRKFHVAVGQRRLRNVQKKRDARENFFFCQTKAIAFLLFAVAVAKTPYCRDPQILLPW